MSAHARKSALDETEEWTAFVLSYGWKVPLRHLSHILGQPEREIDRIKNTGACRRNDQPKGFAELFSLWHGREPADEDWPIPHKTLRGHYEWLGPELALLATLVGNVGVATIAETLTRRLRVQTGDPAAERNPVSVQIKINKIGLESRDVTGGITVSRAGREIGSLAIVQQAITATDLAAYRVGRLWVIPYEAWDAWKAERDIPPAGYVQLSSLRNALAVKSDKLAEFARMGYVPTAVRCKPLGQDINSTQFGTWFVSPETARQLVEDRRAGLPMPWHGKPLLDNLRNTYKLWLERKHPARCETCRDIWGGPPPADFEEFIKRYPPLAHGAKRHLTMKWHPGLTINELAKMSNRTRDHVLRAVENGLLKATKDKPRHITRTDARIWISHRCPTGDGQSSWVSLTSASEQYHFSKAELEGFIVSGELNSKVSDGKTMVLRQQCRNLRESLGFSREEAARLIGVGIEHLDILLEGVDWRKADGGKLPGIPLMTIQAAIKRKESAEGHTIAQAAQTLGVSEQWVRERIEEGTVRVSTASWAPERPYLTAPMMRRLKDYQAQPFVHARAPKMASRMNPLDDISGWLALHEAALEAGVCVATVRNWVMAGSLPRSNHYTTWRYHRDDVRARARIYWKTVRFQRAEPPDWLKREIETGILSPATPRKALENFPARRLNDPVRALSTLADPQTVELAISRLETRDHVIVALSNGRFLFDGVESITAAEVVARAKGT